MGLVPKFHWGKAKALSFSDMRELLVLFHLRGFSQSYTLGFDTNRQQRS